METIDEGMVKPPGHRDNAILQFSPVSAGTAAPTAYSAWVIEVKWSHGRQLAQIKCSPSTMSGAGDVSLAATIFGVAAALKAVNSGALSHHT